VRKNCVVVRNLFVVGSCVSHKILGQMGPPPGKYPPTTQILPTPTQSLRGVFGGNRWTFFDGLINRDMLVMVCVDVVTLYVVDISASCTCWVAGTVPALILDIMQTPPTEITMSMQTNNTETVVHTLPEHRVLHVPRYIARGNDTTSLPLPAEIWLYETGQVAAVYRDEYPNQFDTLVDLAEAHNMDLAATRELAYDHTCDQCRLTCEPHQCGMGEVEVSWFDLGGHLPFGVYQICRECQAKASY
jgi:hypothetical protein